MLALGGSCGGNDTESYYEQLETHAEDVRDDIFALSGPPNEALPQAAARLTAFGAELADLHSPPELAVQHARLIRAIADYADYAAAPRDEAASLQTVLSDPNAPAVRAFTDALCAIEREAAAAGVRIDLGCIGVR